MTNLNKIVMTLLSALMLTGTDSLAADLAKGPDLGQPLAPGELTRWELHVMPDGEGLPTGSGTVAQGKEIYNKRCITCHGPAGQGGSADALAGKEFSLTGEWPEKVIGNYWPYATTLFDFNRRSMPMDAPGSLSNSEVYAITAYLLYLNGIIKENDTLDAKRLKKIKMPNANGFINVYESEK